MTRGKTILLIIAVAVVFAVAEVVTALYRARTFTARPPAKAAPPPGPGSSLSWSMQAKALRATLDAGAGRRRERLNQGRREGAKDISGG